ncbi:MAG TPA: MFS transporter [Prevotella sp.]|jgi:POT family proton-dependent oligopeptide transporter|nr:MFS transporter [Prevotella sp.]
MNEQKGHPKGLYLLFMTEMAERFSYYGMRALFTLYMVAALFSTTDAFQIYGSYTGLVYLTPLLGGYIADRYWGNRRSIITGGIVMAIGQFLMFASACVVKQSIFKDPLAGGTIDPSINNFMSRLFMFSGLAALIIGNGFFKPNISTMVGDLYEPTDHRKDAAFTIFYMGINVGALIAPFICGGIGTGSWNNPTHFRWAFFAAGCAMIISVAIFSIFKNKYLITPEGKQIGESPKVDTVHHNEEEIATENKPKVKNSPLRPIFCLILAIGLYIAFGGLSSTATFNDYISSAVFAIAIAIPIFIITDKTLTRTEMSRIGVIYIIAIFVIFFWSAFEQAGASLTYFAEHNVNRNFFGMDFKTPWFQSVNPICVVCFAPLFAMMWEKLGKKGKEPASPVKQAIGLMLLAIGYAIIAYATFGVKDTSKISMFWLIGLYAIHTCGELSLSPIGLSMVNKLSPARLASLLMGVWFMSNAASNILAGKFSTLFPEPGVPPRSIFGFQVNTLSDFFLIFVVMAGVASIVLFCLCPLLKKMMKGIE